MFYGRDKTFSRKVHVDRIKINVTLKFTVKTYFQFWGKILGLRHSLPFVDFLDLYKQFAESVVLVF